MKNFTKILLLPFFVVLLFAGCKKKDEGPEAQLAKLPAITQTGENNFGCLINGQAFIPDGSMYSGPVLTASYTGNYFSVNGRRNNDEGDPSITIGSTDVDIVEGKTYTLASPDKGNAFGSYRKNGTSNYTQAGGGEFLILKLDKVNRIVSGTFWFDAINDKGEKIEIREGRFDMRF